jgi:tetratricopeptide (TPR) repeat protein
MKNKNDEAMKYYVQAKETGQIEGYLELAKCYMRKKEPDKALKVLDEAIRKYPSETASYELKGKILLSEKKSEDAIKTFEEVEKINPKLGLTHIVNAYIFVNKPEKAMERIRKEIKKQPEQPELMAEMSRIYKIMGKKKDAIENANQIILKKPESPIGYITLAMIYNGDQELDKSVETLRKASRLNDISIPMMLGNTYFLKKDYKVALEQYRKANTIKPGYIPALFQQGSVLYVMGRKKEAIAEYQKVLRLSQNHVPALNNLAYLYTDDNKDMALQLATRAYTLAPNDGFVQDTLGFVLVKNGKVQEGLTALKKALELLPDNPSVHYHIALAYKEYNDKHKAIEHLQKAIRFGEFPEASNAKQLLAKLQKS